MQNQSLNNTLKLQQSIKKNRFASNLRRSLLTRHLFKFLQLVIILQPLTNQTCRHKLHPMHHKPLPSDICHHLLLEYNHPLLFNLHHSWLKPHHIIPPYQPNKLFLTLHSILSFLSILLHYNLYSHLLLLQWQCHWVLLASCLHLCLWKHFLPRSYQNLLTLCHLMTLPFQDNNIQSKQCLLIL